MKNFLIDDPQSIRQADPMAVAVNAGMVPIMTSGGNRNGMSGTGDRRPMVYRDGATDADECPSRMGSRLYYRDGRIEPIVQHLPSEDTEGGEI